VVGRALILLNRAAGRGAKARQQQQVCEAAAAAGVAVEEAGSPQDLERRAREAAQGGCERVIAAGGDGTAHWVLNGVAGTTAAFGIIPCGNGNDLSVNLGIPQKLDAAVQVALSGAVRNVDLCRVEPHGRYFACIASFGLDSVANRYANQHQGLLRGWPLYAWSMLRALLVYRCPHTTVNADNPLAKEYAPAAALARHMQDPAGDRQTWEESMLLLVAANASSYGGGMKIAPHAHMDDGRLDIVAVRHMNRLKLLRCFPEVFSGAHLRRAEVSFLRCTSARIDAGRPLEIFADGEFIGHTPAEIVVVPGVLRVIAP
jgi:diacylglycerol kinase (ATP)